MIDENDLLVQAPCGIFSFSEEGEILMANTYCSKLLEYEPEELKGMNISALLSLATKIFYQTHFYPLVKLHQHTEEVFLNFVSKSKRNVPVVLNAKVTQINNGNVIVCSFIQVLNRRKYEDEILLAKKNAEEALRKNEALEKVQQELENYQKKLDKQVTLLEFQKDELMQLGDIIAHDLQEPVRKLILFSNELLDKGGDAGKKDRALTVIKKSSQRIKTLLLNLQNYLSLSPQSSTERVDLNTVVKEELEQLQKDYGEVQVQLALSFIPEVMGSDEQLRLLIHHVLKNAFEHGLIENNLILTITAVLIKENQFNVLHDKYTYSDYVKITVSDQGPGFESHYKEYIFDVLKKLGAKGEASGFGLAFCKKIAENHYGSIKAESTVGAGASFTILLPVNPLY